MGEREPRDRRKNVKLKRKRMRKAIHIFVALKDTLHKKVLETKLLRR